MDGVKLPSDLEVLLRQTMAEEPSVAFLPRVRERIAAEAMRRSPPWRPIALAGALAAAVIAIVVVPRGGEDVKVPAPPAAPSSIHGTASSVPANPALVEAPALAHEPVRSAARRSRPDLRSSGVAWAAPVIVDPRQRAAIYQMMSPVTRRRVTEENATLLVPPSLRPITERIGEIAVIPVEVSPLGGGGVLQSGPEAKQPPRPADAGFRP